MMRNGHAPPLPGWAVEATLALDIEALAARIVEGCMASAFSDHGGDEQLERGLAAGVLENVSGFRDYLSGRVPLQRITPIRPVTLATLQAHLDISQSAIQQAYRVGSRVMLHDWVRTTREAVAELGIDPAEALETVDVVIEALFDYLDRILREVSTAHAAEQEKMRLSKAQLRRRILRSHLHGETVLSEPELAEALQYPVSENHVTVVLSEATEEAARLIVGALRAATSASSSLVLPLGLAKIALWLSKPSEWAPAAIGRLNRALADEGATASVSTPRAGVDGLKLSLEEAVSVEGVRSAWGEAAPDLISFGEVKLEVLLLADLDAARRFVFDELGGLADGDDKPAAQLRETVLLWFDAGSHVSAAARLDLHEHTVRNRLRRAEELIGHPLTTRRTEMQVALRLHRVVTARPQPTEAS